MAIFTYDDTQFRAMYPAFANVTTFPEATLQMYWDTATSYIADNDTGSYLIGAGRDLALNQMTAHIAALFVLIATGETPGLVQNAGIDKITVGLTPPPFKNQFFWWLSLTPYGQMLLALLQVNFCGGFYVGGLPETAAIRKVGGVF